MHKNFLIKIKLKFIRLINTYGRSQLQCCSRIPRLFRIRTQECFIQSLRLCSPSLLFHTTTSLLVLRREISTTMCSIFTSSRFLICICEGNQLFLLIYLETLLRFFSTSYVPEYQLFINIPKANTFAVEIKDV